MLKSFVIHFDAPVVVWSVGFQAHRTPYVSLLSFYACVICKNKRDFSFVN